MGFISHHIMPLVINHLRDRQTDTDRHRQTETQTQTQTQTHTHKAHTYTHIDSKIYFYKSCTGARLL